MFVTSYWTDAQSRGASTYDDPDAFDRAEGARCAAGYVELGRIDSSRRAALRASGRPQDERFPTLCDSKASQMGSGEAVAPHYTP